MRILPGRPEATVQAVCTGQWAETQHILYISGTSLVILGGIDTLFQTIYHDVELEGIAFDELAGKVAVTAGQTIYVYRPDKLVPGTRRKWTALCTFENTTSSTSAQSLSWGQGSELLVAGSALSLWRIQEDGLPVLTWTEHLANPARLALLSYDGALIASVGYRDRLVKIWRRQTFGYGTPQFDFSYLPHPQTVTAIHWKKPFHRDFSIENVLYTMCRDDALRVWSPVDMHDVHILSLWAVVDLTADSAGPIEPQSAHGEALGPPPRESKQSETGARKQVWMSSLLQALVVLDSKVFTTAVEAAVRSISENEDAENLHRLVDIATRSPELVLGLDDRGNVTAWGMENIGGRSRKTINVFTILHRGENNIGTMLRHEAFVHLLAFDDQTSPTGFSIVAHLSSGEIVFLGARLDKLLDTSSRDGMLEVTGTWAGHSTAIDSLVRTADGQSMLSMSPDVGFIVWMPRKVKDQYTLSQHSVMSNSSLERAQHCIILQSGKYVVTLHKTYLILWNTSARRAREIQRRSMLFTGEWKCFLLMPEADDNDNDNHTYHVAAIASSSGGLVWEILLPDVVNVGSKKVSIGEVRQVGQFDLKIDADLHIILPVDPVGWSFTISGNLDSFNRDVAISLSSTGLLRSWTAKFSSTKADLSWLETSSVQTMILNPSLARGSSIQKVAILSAAGNQLTIWNSRCAQLEFEDIYEDGIVARDLDWTCTPDSQSILAVGFGHQILLLAQLRYDYLHAGPAWAYIRKFETNQITPHPIGDSIWLCDGTLVVGIGNQLLLHPKTIDQNLDKCNYISDLQEYPSHGKAPVDIFEVVSQLNGPLALYHPQFLQQCILAGKMTAVHTILRALLKKLKFSNNISGMSSLLDLDILDVLEPLAGQVGSHGTFTSTEMLSLDEELVAFDEDMALAFLSLLRKISVPHLTESDQTALQGIIECVCQVEEHRRSIDENGARYLLFFKQNDVHHQLSQDSTRINVMSFRDIVWAFHSESQDIILDLVSKRYQNKIAWPQAKEAGIFMWLKDSTAVKSYFEKLARNHYTQAEDKNPVDCSLYYLALKKKTVLLGLWRMASWNKEQASTQKFLANDFNEARWRTAALKNAYALLGKQRFEYAAAFFLLADSLKDAVNVCFNQLKDMQLAIAVARVYEGDDGPVLRELLEEKVLPIAALEGNKWLATWTFWMLSKKDKAVRSLITPVHILVDAVESPGQSSSFFLTDDPALAILYRQLRAQSLQTLRGAEKIPQGDEFEFVLHTARLYDRMGCDALALDLVRNWEFLQSASHRPLMEHDMQNTLRRRSSVVVTDDTGIMDLVGVTGLRKGLTKPPPSVFEEPSMDSFSNFDF